MYDAGAPRALALVEPVAHAPWFGRMPAAWGAVVAAAVIAVLWTATTRTGATPIVAAVICAAVLSRPAVRAPIVLGADVAIGLALVWATALLATSPIAPLRAALWSSAAAALAVSAWPPLIVVMPAIAVGAVAGSRGSAAAVVVGAVVGAAAGLAIWTARAAALSGEAVSVSETLTVLLAPTSGADPYVWPWLTALTLPVLLAAVGAGQAVVAWPRRRRAAAVAAGVVPLAALVALPAWHAEIVRAVQWSSWPLAGAGLAWFAARTPGGRGRWLIGLVGIVLVASGASASIRVVESLDRRAFARRLDAALTPIVSETATTVVTEDTRVDTALVAWGSGLGLQRVRPIPRLVDAAAAAGRTVLAGPAARTALELWGFRFDERTRLTDSFAVAALVGRLRCLPVAMPWRELPGLEYTGRLGLHVPAGDGRLEVVIVGPTPLAPRVTWADGRPVGRLEPVKVDLPTLPPVLWPGDGRLPDATLIGVRVELPGLPDVAQSASLALGQRAPQVAVRYSSPANIATVVTVCAAPLPREEATGDAGVPLIDDAYFAGGWHAVERTGATWFRWTARRAVALLPSEGDGEVTLSVAARPAASGPVTTGGDDERRAAGGAGDGPGRSASIAGRCRVVFGSTAPTSWCSRCRRPRARRTPAAPTPASWASPSPRCASCATSERETGDAKTSSAARSVTAGGLAASP